MSPAYEFDDVRVDPAAYRVSKAGRAVPLEPKAFEVLLFLLENPGRLVEKKELLDRAWPDTVVTESAMTRVIADLRRALGDDAHEARYVETVPTKGYRFVADVRRAATPEALTPAAALPAPATRAPRRAAVWIAAAVVALAIAAVLVLHAPRSRPAPPPSPSARLVQITDSLGLDTFPTFSPDGAHIAYCSDRGGPFEIYVRQLAPGGREIRITSDGRDNVLPAWSPDGRTIAYASRAATGIWLVPAFGGEVRRLTTFGSHPAWSPDGATIAFSSGGGLGLFARSPAAGPPSSLWIVPARGGDPAPLTRPASPAGGHGAPVFSPDGAEVFFTTSALEGEIWSVSIKGGSLRRILPQGEAAPGAGAERRGYFDPAFSPKGDVLYFATADEHLLNVSLWRSRAPAAPGDPWGAPERVTSEGTASARHVAVSPRTGTVAFAALSTVSNLWSLPVDPNTSLPSGSAVPLTQGAGCRNTTPRFSPDGSKIAFASCRVGSSMDLWVMDRDGGNARPLTDGPWDAIVADWLPGGQRVAFLTFQGPKRELWAVTLEDRTQKKVLDIPDDARSMSLSPDGGSLAFSTEAPEDGTWVAPRGGGPPRRVSSPRANASYPCWSRDGRTLAVQVLGSLATVPAGGGPLSTLVKEKGPSWPYDFSPNDERISFAGQRDGIWNVYWVARKDGTVRRLTDNTLRRTFLRYPAWSPQGDRIVYERSETTGNVWLLDTAK